eukprot:TRINITY_DN6903_c1_g2_i1.p1 TRINITY_DN6903_c1_g2~~TRINITY_DN6903_c1_g2_i1.p1  ORF type:complete len:530 (+),score=168.80 TRINITY_DN6903_c1_g2_i1:39-1628(+)
MRPHGKAPGGGMLRLIAPALVLAVMSLFLAHSSFPSAKAAKPWVPNAPTPTAQPVPIQKLSARPTAQPDIGASKPAKSNTAAETGAATPTPASQDIGGSNYPKPAATPTPASQDIGGSNYPKPAATPTPASQDIGGSNYPKPAATPTPASQDIGASNYPKPAKSNPAAETGAATLTPASEDIVYDTPQVDGEDRELIASTGHNVTIKVPPRPIIGVFKDRLADVKLQDLKLHHVPKAGGTYLELVSLKFGEKWGYEGGKDFIYPESRVPVRVRAKPRPWRKLHDKEEGISKDGVCSMWHVPFTRLSQYLSDNNVDLAALSPYMSKELFATVRHPTTRFLSEYKYSIDGNWFNWQVFTLGYSSKVKGVGLWEKKKFMEAAKNLCSAEALNEFTINLLADLQARLEGRVGDDRDKVQPRLLSGDCHYVPQWEYMYDLDGRQRVFHILRTEQLTPDFVALMEHVDGGRLPASIMQDKLPKAIAGKRHTFHKAQCSSAQLNLSHFNATALDAIYRFYKTDFDLFGYSRDPPAS